MFSLLQLLRINVSFIKMTDPKYILPSRLTIMRELLPSAYEKTKAKLLSKLSELDWCTFTTDLWMSRTTQGYLTLTCHFCTDEWKLPSVVLETIHVDESHTAEHLAEALHDITNRWGITEQVVAAITDNANNINKAIN
jgi:hypothetical protein